ncbi:MAG: hypothetical protein GY719_29435 [bacterium]|nr:hypothetical protein [bacterium]
MAPRVAYFVSSHGFGHAARACAVIEAVWRRRPDIRFELFTQTPAWFFEHSLERPVAYHEAVTDLGLVQRSSLEEDLEESVRRLSDWIPFDRPGIDALAATVTGAGCRLVICDVSPIGLEVARRASLPSILIENFTWDWIYRAYSGAEPRLRPIAEYLAEIFDGAGRRIQAEPICDAVPGALSVPPVSRRPRIGRRVTRERLGVPDDAPLVMVTMGGVEWTYRGLEDRLAGLGSRDLWLVIPGSVPEARVLGRAVLLPHHSDFYHPDLVHASDAVIGKLGYSTVAEVDSAGLPFGYVPRPSFPESPPVEAWVQRHLPCRRIGAEAFVSWRWLGEIEALLDLPRDPASPPGGGDAIAAAILQGFS